MSSIRLPRAAWVALSLISPASFASAQVVNPATAHTPESLQEQVARQRSWEMPTTVVTGESWSPYRESDLIGSYGQPRWSARRLFPTTRTYVIPEGQFEVEHWTRVKTPRDGKSTVETQYEIEFGLPNRFQIDLYYVTEKTGSDGELDVSEQKYELRYALADWGKIPWNPTLYAEWASVTGGPDKFETKLLLADEVSPGWKVGANLSYEREVGGDLANEYMATLGVARTVRDEKLSLGGEMRVLFVDTHADRGNFTEELEIGPSVQWRPLPAMHMDFAPLFGIGDDSLAMDLFFVLGWEF